MTREAHSGDAAFWRRHALRLERVIDRILRLERSNDDLRDLAARVPRPMSLAELARTIGVSRQAMCRFERGTNRGAERQGEGARVRAALNKWSTPLGVGPPDMSDAELLGQLRERGHLKPAPRRRRDDTKQRDSDI